MSLVPYDPSNNFNEDEADGASGRSTVRTAAVDAELAAIKAFTESAAAAVNDVRRDDGELNDQIVKVHALASDVLALIGSSGFNPVGSWLTATAYSAKDLVIHGAGSYVCVVAHTSGVWATDLAAGKWAVLFDSAAMAASAITVTPASEIFAANVQSALEELVANKMRKDANLSDVGNTATARSNLGAASATDVAAIPEAVRNQSYSRPATVTGTADSINAQFSPVLAALTIGDVVRLTPIGSNTAAIPTLDATTPSSPKNIMKVLRGGTKGSLDVGDYNGAREFSFQYDGTDFVLMDPIASNAYSFNMQGAYAPSFY